MMQNTAAFQQVKVIFKIEKMDFIEL